MTVARFNYYFLLEYINQINLQDYERAFQEPTEVIFMFPIGICENY